jgi:hypothetical protein
VSFNSEDAFGSVAFGTASPYLNLPPGSYLMELYDAGIPLPYGGFSIDPPILGGEVITFVYYGRDGVPMYPDVLTYRPSDREWILVP